MKKSNLAKAVIMVATFLSFTTVTFSCQWRGGIPPICAVYSEANIVFEGLVTSIGEKYNEPSIGEVHLVTFSVERKYKGLISNNVFVYGYTHMCTTKYEKNKRYLIYATQSSQDRYRALRAQLADGEDKEKSIKEDFDFLENIMLGKASPAIHGMAYDSSGIAVKNVYITIEGEGKTYKTLSKNDGYFSVSSVPPGTYKIRCTVLAPTLIAIYDKKMKSKKFQNFNIAEIEVTITNDSCSYTQFELHNYEK